MCRYLHRNIIQCFGVYVHIADGLLMERGDGDIFDLRAASGPFDDDTLDAFACDLINAVSFLHAQSPPIYHLDLKLENLLHCQVIGYGQVLKVADFGLAHSEGWTDETRKFGSQGSGPHLCGSPAYIPHGDLGRLQSFMPHRDAWAIGCILFAMAYGGMLYSDTKSPAYQRLWSKITNDSEKNEKNEKKKPQTFAALFNFTPRYIESILAELLRREPAALESLRGHFLSSVFEVCHS